MVNRNYSSVVGVIQLTSAMTSGSTSVTVDTVGGTPAVPFTLVIDPGNGSEEITTVTEVSGTTLTLIRGEDGTGAVAHTSGAQARHAATGRDFREPQEHIAASTAVHGLASGVAVVGTTTVQTLTNKTISGANNTFEAIPGGALNANSVPVAALVSADVLDADKVAGITPYIQAATPTHSGAAGTAFWIKTV